MYGCRLECPAQSEGGLDISGKVDAAYFVFLVRLEAVAPVALVVIASLGVVAGIALEAELYAKLSTNEETFVDIEVDAGECLDIEFVVAAVFFCGGGGCKGVADLAFVGLAVSVGECIWRRGRRACS